jgi:hypothetical protein
VNRLKARLLATAFAEIDRMSADELLAYVDTPLFPSQLRNPDSASVAAHRYATARLDRLTSSN